MPWLRSLLMLMGAGSILMALAPNLIDALPVSETPESMDLAEAASRALGEGMYYVSLEATLDHERHMHPTPLREPSHTTACAPDEELDLAGEPSLALLEQTLGCAVYLEVEDEFDIVVTVKDGVMNRETNTFEINFLRSLSAVSGYGLRLWVVSPNFVTKPEVEDEFPDRSAYSGVLVRSDEVRASSQRLDRMVAELAKTLQEESGW